MYRVIVKVQKPDYEWEKKTFGPLDTKKEANDIHDRKALTALQRLCKGEIVDYQIETIEKP